MGRGADFDVPRAADRGENHGCDRYRGGANFDILRATHPGESWRRSSSPQNRFRRCPRHRIKEVIQIAVEQFSDVLRRYFSYHTSW